MKIAIVHEMLVKLGGAEKVVETWMKMFPEAPIFTLMYDETKTGEVFPKSKINPQVFSLRSQKIYNLFKKQNLCLLFMASSLESLDLSQYDIILVSSSAFAHGIITKPETKVITYSHSPARYLWDWTNEYKRDIWWNKWIKWFILNRVFLRLRQWDYMAGQRSDVLLANSANTASRIKKYYRRESEILYPPVETKRFATPQSIKGDYYIIISALTAFKKIEIAIEAFNKTPDKQLKVIWSWGDQTRLQKLAEDNIEFTGWKYGEDLVELVRGSLGLIFPWEEDFGIVPIEVMAAGKPVFALDKGWLLETVIPGETWEFFSDPQGLDFIENFEEFNQNNQNWKYSPQDCQSQASKFDTLLFEEKIKKHII